MMLAHLSLAPNRPSLPASLTEVSGLFRHIRDGLQELDALARSAQVMEDELQLFLASYYGRVLPLTARLERLRYRKTHGVFPQAWLAVDRSSSAPKKHVNILAQRQKALFRRLAKRCHPDHKSATTSISIEEVYGAKTLSALWLLEIRCVCDALESNDAMNRYLDSERAEMAKLLAEARHYITSVKASDMWQLKERVYDAALQGEDLIEQIQCRIEQQIAALQQYFVKPHKYRAAA